MKARTAPLNEMEAGAEARLVDNLTDKRYFETQNYFESRVTPGAVARAHSWDAGLSRRCQRRIDFQIRREVLMRRDEHEQFNL